MNSYSQYGFVSLLTARLQVEYKCIKMTCHSIYLTQYANVSHCIWNSWEIGRTRENNKMLICCEDAFRQTSSTFYLHYQSVFIIITSSHRFFFNVLNSIELDLVCDMLDVNESAVLWQNFAINFFVVVRYVCSLALSVFLFWWTCSLCHRRAAGFYCIV